MPVASNRRFVLALAAAALLAATAPARAAAEDDDISAPDAGTLRREWVGLELTPVSLATSQPPYRGPDQSFSALQGGPGANIRLFRYRWEHAYVIPIMAGLYVSQGGDTVLALLQGEGGVIVPGTDRRLELGAGLGLGVLSMRYSNTCDGSCLIGGGGWMASFAARFLFVNRARFTAGVGVRAIIPLQEGGGDVFGYNTGHSSVVMGVLEVGFGRP